MFIAKANTSSFYLFWLITNTQKIEVFRDTEASHYTGKYNYVDRILMKPNLLLIEIIRRGLLLIA